MDVKRASMGVGWGVVATIGMSAVMITGQLSGLSPMPRPIPIALVSALLGSGLPKPALIALGATSHLVYGGLAAGVFALLVPRVTVRKGLLLGVALWLLMQLVWLPFLGWGVFGTAVTPKIAGATLVLHLVYGGLTGWLIDRRARGTAATVA